MAVAHAENTAPTSTVITDNKVDYARLVAIPDRNNFTTYMAAIGGHVTFTGAAPVYVSIRIAGQVYNAPTDLHGNYSFFVYTPGDNRFTSEAWTADGQAPVGGHNVASAVAK